MKSNKFVGTVSNKFNINEALNTVGNTLTGIFGKPEQNITYVNQPKNDDNGDEDEDNTLLYAGIGGGVLLLVVLLIVFLR